MSPRNRGRHAVGFLVALLLCCGIATAQPEKRTAKPWERIAVLGASLTAGFGNGQGIGVDVPLATVIDLLISKEHRPARGYIGHDWYGDPVASGRRILEQAESEGATMLVAIDFPFWFAYGGDSAEKPCLQRVEAALAMLDGWLDRNKGPILVGTIPKLEDGGLFARLMKLLAWPADATLAKASRRIEAWAKERERVTLIPLANWIAPVRRDEAVTIGPFSWPAGSRAKLLQPDGLHPTLEGACGIAAASLAKLANEQDSVPADVFSKDADEIERRIVGYLAMHRGVAVDPLARRELRVQRVKGIPDSLLLAIDMDREGRRGVIVGGSHEGDPASVLQTTDGGANWKPVTVPGAGRLYDVSFIDDRSVVAVGLKGRILRSADGGRTWTERRLGEGWLAAVAFATPKRGFVVGTIEGRSAILRSDDGGLSWKRRVALPPEVALATLRSIRFLDENRGFVVGYPGVVLSTDDGGESWSLHDRKKGYLRGLAAVLDSVWIAGGPGIVLRSADRGRSWLPLHFPGKHKLTGIGFSSGVRGCAAAMDGTLFETRDGGNTWTAVHRVERRHLVDVLPPSADRPGFVVGSRGTLLRLSFDR